MTASFMNFFLIEYDVLQHKTIRMEKYDPSQERFARSRRLAWELDAYRSGKKMEVLILGARDEESLRKTHGRYFEEIETLMYPKLPIVQ